MSCVDGLCGWVDCTPQADIRPDASQFPPLVGESVGCDGSGNAVQSAEIDGRGEEMMPPDPFRPRRPLWRPGTIETPTAVRILRSLRYLYASTNSTRNKKARRRSKFSSHTSEGERPCLGLF
jgi:hypothetical protein